MTTIFATPRLPEPKRKFRRLNPYRKLHYPNEGKTAPTSPQQEGLGTHTPDERQREMGMRAACWNVHFYLTERRGRFGSIRHRLRDCSGIPKDAIVHKVDVTSNRLLTDRMRDCKICYERIREALQYQIDHCAHLGSQHKDGRDICLTCRMDITALVRSGWFDDERHA